MARKAGKAKAVGKKKAGKKKAAAKKAPAKKSAVKKAKKAKKVAKKASAPKAMLGAAALPKPAAAPKPAPITITPIVSKCVNDYLDANRPGWNDDGAGNSKNLSDLHLTVPLFLDNVRRCLEAKTSYTFDVTAVTAAVLGGTVSKAKQEIVLAAQSK